MKWKRLLPPGHELLEVPCGTCLGCSIDHSRDWAVRAMHEAQTSESWNPDTGVWRANSAYITLTYDDAHLPHQASLHLPDWQNFAKKMRRDLGPFRFLMCGEYGDDNGRPHYHACIFGHDFADDRELVKHNHQGDALYTSPTLRDLWGRGHVLVGDVTFQSAAYVARYVIKKRHGKLNQEHYEWTDPETGEVIIRPPEFVNMSRRKGLGHAYFMRFYKEIAAADSVVLDGKQLRRPKYYDKLLQRLDPQKLEANKEDRKRRAQRRDNSPERGAVREYILQQKAGRLKRPL